MKLGYNINFNYKYGSFLITIKGFDNGDIITKIFKIPKENYYFYSKKTIQDFSKSNIKEVNNIIHQFIDENQNNYQMNENFLGFFKNKVNISNEEIEELNYYFDTIKQFINNKFINKFENYNESHYDFIFNFYLWKYFSYLQFYYQVIGSYNEFIHFYNHIKQKEELNWEEKLKILFFYFEKKIYEQF